MTDLDYLNKFMELAGMPSITDSYNDVEIALKYFKAYMDGYHEMEKFIKKYKIGTDNVIDKVSKLTTDSFLFTIKESADDNNGVSNDKV